MPGAEMESLNHQTANVDQVLQIPHRNRQALRQLLLQLVVQHSCGCEVFRSRCRLEENFQAQ